METEETENGNGKLKRKSEMEKLKLGNGRQYSLRKWHLLRMRDLFGAKSQYFSLDIYQFSLTAGYKISGST